jgi:hypothetical protein
MNSVSVKFLNCKFASLAPPPSSAAPDVSLGAHFTNCPLFFWTTLFNGICSDPSKQAKIKIKQINLDGGHQPKVRISARAMLPSGLNAQEHLFIVWLSASRQTSIKRLNRPSAKSQPTLSKIQFMAND